MNRSSIVWLAGLVGMGILAGGAEAAVKITMTPLTGKTFQAGVGVAATPQAVTLTVVCSDTDLAQCVNPITYQFTMELQGKVNRLSTAPIAGASSVNNTDGYGITPRAGVTTGAGTGKQAIAITLDWAAAASLAPGKYFVRWSLNLSNGSGLNQTFVSSSYASSALEVLGGDKIPVITAMDATPACNYPPANLCVLKGKNLNWPGTEIKIGGFALGIRELSPESVTYVIASNPAIATSPLVVSNPAGIATSATPITMPVSISSFSPLGGAPGTTVTLTGNNFSSAITDVRVGGKSVGTGNFTVVSPSEMTAVVPVGGIDNKILIYWANPLNRVAQSKELFAQLPSISAFSPNEGKAGNTIKLSGVNLGQVNLVTIDGISQSIISATRTALELELSQNNLPGMKSIMAKNAAGTAESKPFNVLPKVTVSVSNLLPKGMLEGRATTVTITGDHFEEVTSVMMNGVAQNIVSRSANQLKIELPADAKTGPIILQAADIKQVVDAGLFLVSKRRLIASGRKRTCAVNQDNTVKCWGLIPENVAPKGAFAMGGYVDSAAKLVPSLKSVATVVVGLYESCVLINDGSIQCWGAKTYWNNIDPFSTTPYLIEGLKYPAVDITIAQWNNTFCALTEMQSVYCWGNGEYISNVKTGLEKNVIAIEASSTSHCALMTDGTIKCWTDGQLPKQVGGINARAIEIAADSGNYFVLTDQGRVLKFKQGELSAYQLEVDVSTLIRGSGGACASMKSGNFKCWVNNGDYGTSMPANLAPTLTSLTDTLAVGIGGGFACIMSRTGTIRCMSSGIGGWAHHYGEGQLGDGYYDGLPVTPSSTTSGYTTIASGYGQHCAITSTGLTRCWGTNLPDNYEIVDLNIKAMVIGALHKCALTDAGSVKCWGNNQYGQLGNNRTGTNSVNEYVTPIGLTSGVKSIAGSGAYTCALLTTGKVKCWGALFSSPPMSSTPSPVLSAPTTIGNLVESVKAIFSGDFRTCAILSTGIIKCWSFNFQDSPTATELSGFKAPINALAIGYEHLCALTSTKEVQCLGVNSFGQVGNGQWSYYVSTPQDVYNLGNDIVEITAQARSTCARNTTGKIKCWGQQPNAVSNLFAPKEVLGLDAGITKISAETNSTCALNQQGAVKCWGRPSSEGTVRNNLGLDTSKYYNEELIPVQDAP